MLSKNLLNQCLFQVAYSGNGIGRGRLVYGHFGRYEDFQDLSKRHGLNFTDSVVILKTNHLLYNAGSMVKNAQIFGAKGVILFPDPNCYILSREGTLGNLGENVTVSHSVKFVPGDPNGPYSQEKATLPKIPVISIDYKDAKVLLSEFTNSYNIAKTYWFGLPLNTSKEMHFQASIEVYTKLTHKKLNNVIGTIPGRFEPSRYIVVGSHHDSWHQGASKPGIGHSVLMELSRILGHLHKIGWAPGRSLIFASWDGEEYGNLGSTSWMYSHSKELTSRGLAYINLDFLLQGADEIHLAASPLLRNIVISATKSLVCSEDDGEKEKAAIPSMKKPCQLYTELMEILTGNNMTEINRRMSHTSYSVFQNILGISSLDISIKNRHSASGDIYPYVSSKMDTADKAITHLELQHAVSMTKFLIIVILKLITPVELPLTALEYGNHVQADVNIFLSKYADDLAANRIDITGIQKASKEFVEAAKNFHFFYNPTPALDMLAHHDFNDQLMELERAFLLPPFVSTHVESLGDILNGPFRQIIYGPSPINHHENLFLPRLTTAIEMAKHSTGSWEVVRREMFFVEDALHSAECVLDNHLIFPPAKKKKP